MAFPECRLVLEARLPPPQALVNVAGGKCACQGGKGMLGLRHALSIDNGYVISLLTDILANVREIM